MVKKYIAKENKPEIKQEEVNVEKISRHLNSDGKQLYIRIPTKVSTILDLKKRQEVELIINYGKKTINLNIKDNIVNKTKRKSNLIKKKK